MSSARERAEAMARECAGSIADEIVRLWPNVVMEGWHEEGAVEAMTPRLTDLILAAKAEALEEAAGRMIEIASHVSGDSLGWDECCEAAAEDIRALAAQEREG